MVLAYLLAVRATSVIFGGERDDHVGALVVLAAVTHARGEPGALKM